jgi:tripeptide aminopeptidase
MQHIIDRFISYVTVDTESDPNSETTPSTAKQWVANQLVEELKNIGMQDVTIDDKSYIMATLPSNVDHEVPTIGFVSHFDTTPDFTGANVKPQIIPNYDGKYCPKYGAKYYFVLIISRIIAIQRTNTNHD